MMDTTAMFAQTDIFVTDFFILVPIVSPSDRFRDPAGFR